MTTWDSANKSASVTLSNGALTATSTGAVSQSARSTTSRSTGLIYIEFSLSTLTNDIAVGIANASEALNVPGGLGADAYGLGFYAKSPPQATYCAGAPLNDGTTASANGEVVGMAINLNTGTVWIQTAVMIAAGTPWNNSATANPLTGAGGQPMTGLAAGPYFAFFNDDLGGAVCTANFGATAFARTVPAGYGAWDSYIGTAGGTSTATAVGQSRATASGTAAGTSAASAYAPSSTVGKATAGGTSTALGVGQSIATVVGVAAGQATVIGLAGASFAGPSYGEFDPAPTIISQYSNSPALALLIEAMRQWIEPAPLFDAFYADIWNIATARGIGLDIWGRIVGVTRVLQVASGTYLGFAEAADNTSETPFNQQPLYGGTPTTSNYALTDDAFRTLIYAKALANISDGSVKSINQILRNLFPGQGNCYVADGGNMTMTYTFNFHLSTVNFAIVSQSGVLPRPPGVAVSVAEM